MILSSLTHIAFSPRVTFGSTDIGTSFGMNSFISAGNEATGTQPNYATDKTDHKSSLKAIKKRILKNPGFVFYTLYFVSFSCIRIWDRRLFRLRQCRIAGNARFYFWLQIPPTPRLHRW